MKISLILNLNSKQADDLVEELVSQLFREGYEVLGYEVERG